MHFSRDSGLLDLLIFVKIEKRNMGLIESWNAIAEGTCILKTLTKWLFASGREFSEGPQH